MPWCTRYLPRQLILEVLHVHIAGENSYSRLGTIFCFHVTDPLVDLSNNTLPHGNKRDESRSRPMHR